MEPIPIALLVAISLLSYGVALVILNVINWLNNKRIGRLEKRIEELQGEPK